MENLENKVQGSKTYVLDTSFILDLSELEFWAIEPYQLMIGPRQRIIIPDKVEREYNWLMECKQTDDFGIPIPNVGIRNFFEGEEMVGYRKALRKALCKKMDEESFYRNGPGGKCLTITDKLIIQAALDNLNICMVS